MRILVDEHDIAWDDAWTITRGTLSYTNHTLLPEALETWPVELFGRLLPRHLQIIYLINWLHLKEASGPRLYRSRASWRTFRWCTRTASKRVRMAHLAFLGSHGVNGVSALHTDLLRKTVFHDLAERRRRASSTRPMASPSGAGSMRPIRALTRLLVDTLGERVLDDPRCLRELEPLADDADFVARYRNARANKSGARRACCTRRTGVRVAAGSAVRRADQAHPRIQAAIAQYPRDDRALSGDPRASRSATWVPRVKIFAGKAAASYERAKLIIKLANDVAEVDQRRSASSATG